MSDAHSDSNAGMDDIGREANLQRISSMLDQLKSCLDLPVNFKPRIPDSIAPQTRTASRAHNQPKVIKNEEYYLEHAPTELVSALMKVLVEALIRTNTVSTVE